MAKRGRPRKKQNPDPLKQNTLPPTEDEHLDISALETWLWDAACAIRGATDAPKFKDLILPLVRFKYGDYCHNIANSRSITIFTR